MKHSKTKIDRVFFHYTELEEYAAGMWKRPTGFVRKQFVEAAADLMRCPDEFKLAMEQAAEQWRKSCAQNLTCYDSNRIAWLGHAGCCIATGSPEECTRVGWHTLTSDEQDEANRVAAEVLEIWDMAYEIEKCSKTQLELMFCLPQESVSAGLSRSSEGSI
jgi:hypothetical protein